MSWATWVCETPDLATTEICENSLCTLATRCTSAGVNRMIDAPARLSTVPNFAIPESTYFLGARVVRIVTFSPTWKWPVSAVCLSTTIC